MSEYPTCRYCGSTVNDVNNELCYQCEFEPPKLMIDNMKLLDALLNTRQLKLLRYIEASNGEYVPLEKFAEITNASRQLAKYHLVELVKRGVVVFNPITKVYKISEHILKEAINE